MKIIFRYLLLFLCAGVYAPAAYAQKEISDSVEMSEEGRNAKTDEIFFDAIKAKMHNDDSAAKKLFFHFAEVRPGVSDADYELAKYYYNDKNLNKAEEYIKKAISLSGDNKWYKEEYANILADKGSFADAASIMAALYDQDPEDRSYPLLAAEFYEHAKKYEEAIKYLDKALAQVGAEDDILLRKAQLYLQMNETAKAAGVMEQMIARDPKNGKNYKLLGELYDNNKMPEKAATVYETGKKIIPNDPYIQLGLADHYLKKGDSASYIEYVKKVAVNKELDAEIQLDFLKSYIQSLPNDSSMIRKQALPIMSQLVAQHQDDAEVLEFYGEFLEIINQPDSAIAPIKKSLALKPANYDLWDRLLQLYSERASADSLIKYSEKAIRLFPNQSILHYYNGLGHYYKKEYLPAIKAVNRAIDMMPDSDKGALSGMYSFLGDIFHADNEDDLSDKAYSKALALKPDDALILNNYSYYLSERGARLDEAEQMSKKAMELKPDEATFLDTYGWIQYKKGAFENARTYIQKAIALSGPRADATLYDHLGNVFYKLNDKDKAVENWKIAKEKGGDDPLIDKKISEGKLYE
jgi:tetratricopeptide (TPR) repeat protein